MDDRVAIVTGGGSGIGAATARLLAARGLTVALVGRGRERLEAVAAELDGRALVVPADLAQADAPAAVVAEVLDATGGRLDVVVNNAARFVLRPVGEWTRDEVEATLGVNVLSPFFLVQEALPALRRSPAPVVVNVSSAAARTHRVGQAAYGLSKAALEHMTRQLAFELAPQRIRVVGVMPGPVETEIHAGAGEDPVERLAILERLVPLGRIGRPEDVARWIALLVDREAEWVTGAIVDVDGGRVLGAPPSPA